MNILRYKQKAQNWMPRGDDSDSSDSGDSESRDRAAVSNAVTSSGAETGGIGSSGPHSGSGGELSSMFGNYTPGGSDLGPGAAVAANQGAPTQSQTINDNYNTYGNANPSWLERMGVIPGMSVNNFFDRETPAQQEDRMGMVGTGLGMFGSAITNAMMPAPFRMALGGLSAYNNYQNTGNVGQSIGMGLSSLPGYASAAGNAIQGNYGSALSRIAGLNGVGGLESSLAGMGLDAATGKDVTQKVYSLGGMYAGNKLGGPVGGVLGNQLGNQFARLQGYK